MKQSIILVIIIQVLFVCNLTSQTKSTLELKAYADSYYSYFTDDIPNNQLQRFTTVSPRDRQFGLNVAQIGLHYESKNIRSNITLHHGDIMEATWSDRFRNVQEANIGVHLFPNWWLDMGLFRTHIGTESFLPKNNFVSSTAVLTYNEPFFQAGARLKYEGSSKYDLELWVVNGYNLFQDINKDKSVGILFTYNLNKNNSITYTNLIGNEQPIDYPGKILRTYHNIYFTSEFKKEIKLSFGVDYGTENDDLTNEFSTMYGGVGAIKIKLVNNLSIAVRQEVFNDPNGFISGLYQVGSTFNFAGLQVQGTTLGLEYAPSESSYIRAEGRYLSALDDRLILFNNESNTSRLELMVTMGCFFNKKW